MWRDHKAGSLELPVLEHDDPCVGCFVDHHVAGVADRAPVVSLPSIAADVELNPS